VVASTSRSGTQGRRPFRFEACLRPQPPASPPDELALVSGVLLAGSGWEGERRKPCRRRSWAPLTSLEASLCCPLPPSTAGLLPKCKPRLPSRTPVVSLPFLKASLGSSASPWWHLRSSSALEDPSSAPASLHVDHRLRHLHWLTFAWRMRCRHRCLRCSLRADALPLGPCSVGGYALPPLLGGCLAAVCLDGCLPSWLFA
jgi:hypothetical protein